ncbi:hypothetical protein [Methylobacterium iners]|uniref:Uncharacterized protein n=1 Tax=Methylobacterium iners TaxID=418707 RepID=A0ABQ4RVP1_9HYPH|nr:hypothetical protein [Methylobacterium iners]GJD94794.1 hypothetical protein OCOJLMKI_1998 [Methylobacterium iners]
MSDKRIDYTVARIMVAVGEVPPRPNAPAIIGMIYETILEADDTDEPVDLAYGFAVTFQPHDFSGLPACSRNAALVPSILLSEGRRVRPAGVPARKIF